MAAAAVTAITKSSIAWKSRPSRLADFLELCSPVPLPQVGVTIATTSLLQALGISLPAVSHNRELLKSDFVAEGATQQEL
jgi:hypothetical protein